MNRLSGSIVVLVLCVSSLAACATAQSPAPSNSLDALEATPEFSGPYAEQFREIYEESDNDVVKEYILDEKISEAEYQAVLGEYRTCLSARGITLVSYDETGSSLRGDPALIAQEDIVPQSEECAERSGESTVIAMFQVMTQDPENEITTETIVECLIRAGVVPDSFSVAEYATGGLDLLHPPEVLYEPSGATTLTKIEACNDDPIRSYPG